MQKRFSSFLPTIEKTSPSPQATETREIPERSPIDKLIAEFENRIGKVGLPTPSWEIIDKTRNAMELAIREKKEELLEEGKFDLLISGKKIETVFEAIQKQLKEFSMELLNGKEEAPSLYIDHLVRVLSILFAELKFDRKNLSKEIKPNEKEQILKLRIRKEVENLQNRFFEEFQKEASQETGPKKNQQIFIQKKQILIQEFNQLHAYYLEKFPNMLSFFCQQTGQAKQIFEKKQKQFLKQPLPSRRLSEKDCAEAKTAKLIKSIERKTEQILKKIQGQTNVSVSIEEVDNFFQSGTEELQAYLEKLKNEVNAQFPENDNTDFLMWIENTGSQMLLKLAKAQVAKKQNLSIFCPKHRLPKFSTLIFFLKYFRILRIILNRNANYLSHRFNGRR